MVGSSSEKDDVARGTVHVGQTASVPIPQIAQITKELCRVILGAGLIDPHRVEVCHTGELLGLVAISTDDSTAVTEYANDAAVLPVRDLVHIGQFQHSQKIVGCVLQELFSVFRLLLDIGYKTGPRPAFEFIKHRGAVFCHKRFLLSLLSCFCCLHRFVGVPWGRKIMLSLRKHPPVGAFLWDPRLRFVGG